MKMIVRLLPVFLLAAFGCTGETPLPGQGQSSERGDVLIMVAGLDPDNINPLVAPYQFSGMISDLISYGLVGRAVNEQGLVYEPALAESWLWSQDKLSLTYILRKDLVWADGQPITSADVAFTQELTANPKVASNWLGDTKHIREIQTPDPQTVIFHFHAVQNPMLQQGYTIRGVLPKHIWKDVDPASVKSHPSSRKPLASGPFTVIDWQHNDRILLGPNPKALPRWQPKLSGILIKIQPEYNTRLLSLRKGDADLMSSIEFADIPDLKTDERLRLVRQPASSMQYIGYNQQEELFQDIRVRSALTYGLNREKLIVDLLTVEDELYGQSCVGTVSPLLDGWIASDLKPLPFDPEKAGALLTEAGWVDSDGDGIRDKDGKPLQFTMLVQNGFDILRQISILTQAQWKKIGVQLDISTLDPTTFSDRARGRNYQAILWAFGGNPKVDPSIQWSSDGQYNWFSYSNPEVDKLIKQGTSSVEIPQAQAAFQEVQRLVHADQPVTFLFWQDEVHAIDRRFENVQMDTFSNLRHAEKWNVPAEKRLR